MVTCSICGKELTNAVSIWRGIGPECIMSVKNEQVGQGTLFASRAKYDYRIRDGVLMLTDLGGARSLTNDIEVVLGEIEETEGGISEYKIMYRDSYGEWAGIIYKSGSVTFFSLAGTTDQDKALKNLNKRWKLASTTL